MNKCKMVLNNRMAAKTLLSGLQVDNRRSDRGPIMCCLRELVVARRVYCRWDPQKYPHGQGCRQGMMKVIGYDFTYPPNTIDVKHDSRDARSHPIDFASGDSHTSRMAVW